MEMFTAFEYLLINVANNFGYDKLTYQERIQWVKDNIQSLESLAEQAENRPEYIKGVIDLRNAQKGKPIGSLVGLDAVCSGMQIMSALTGCIEGAKATGLINTGLRPDAYTEGVKIMSQLLETQFNVERKKIKKAIMVTLYGSSRKPKELLGDGTPEYKAFYKMLNLLCPGSFQLLQVLLNSWNSTTLAHEWKMPDGFDVRVPVIDKSEARVSVDELGGSSFTFQFSENRPLEKGLSNAANVVHATDAFLLREVVRRCSYNEKKIAKAKELLQLRIDDPARVSTELAPMVDYLQLQYARSKMPSIRVLDYLDSENVFNLTSEYAEKLLNIIETMKHKSFEVITIHDDYRAHPNYLNHLRKHYNNILAAMAESEMLDDVLSQIYGRQGTFPKLSSTAAMAENIRNSDYAIC